MGLPAQKPYTHIPTGTTDSLQTLTLLTFTCLMLSGYVPWKHLITQNLAESWLEELKTKPQLFPSVPLHVQVFLISQWSQLKTLPCEFCRATETSEAGSVNMAGTRSMVTVSTGVHRVSSGNLWKGCTVYNLNCTWLYIIFTYITIYMESSEQKVQMIIMN